MVTDMLEKPEDLISAQMAAVICGKSLSSVRAWVRKNKLTGYRQDPDRSNSALMISRSELEEYLLRSNAAPAKQTTIKNSSKVGRPPAPSVSLGSLEIEMKELRSQLAVSEARYEAQQSVLKQQEELIAELREMRGWLKGSLDEQKAKNERLQTQVVQMTAYFSMPWWRRVSAGVPLLEDKS